MPDLVSKVKSVIVTLGGKGLVLADQGGNISEIAAVKVKVTTTHGAGDCFVGVLTAKLAEGTSLLDASFFANQQAAAFVSRQI
jgi:ribokinase